MTWAVSVFMRFQYKKCAELTAALRSSPLPQWLSLIKYLSRSRGELAERLKGQKRLRWPGTVQMHALSCQGVNPYLRSVDVVCPPCPVSNSRCNPDNMLRAEVTNSEWGIVPQVRSPASSPALSHFPTDGLRLSESSWFTQLPVCNVSITVCTHMLYAV